jgi:hypothetical protein
MTLRPLREDPTTNELLRLDLEEAARAPHAPFDLDRAMERFAATLPLVPLAADTSVGTAAGAGKSLLTKAVSILRGWKGAVVGLLFVGSGVCLAVNILQRAPAPGVGQEPGPPSQARPASPSAAPVPVPESAAPSLPPAAPKEAPRPHRRIGQAPAARSQRSVEDTAPSAAALPSSGKEVRVAETPVQREPPRSSQSAGTLAQEVAQLAQVKALLEVDPARALALAQRGHELFAEGALYEEREAMALLALGRLGRTEALRVRAERFLVRYPTSAFHERIRGLLKP